MNTAARPPLSARETGRNLSVAAAGAGLATKVLMDAGMPADYMPFAGPIIMAALGILGNVWRNVRTNSKLARWVG